MEVKNKWNPGSKSAYPFHAGTNHSEGISIRTKIAIDVYSNVIKFGGSQDDLGKIANFSLLAADALLEKLFPAPIAVVAQSPHQENNQCEHVEVRFDSNNGTFQCMNPKCLQKIDPSVIQTRTKKK